jgi:hypothetical protein
VRAAVLADVLAFLDSTAPGERARVEATLPPDVVETIAEASRVAWLPVEVDIALSDHLLARMGTEAFRRFSVRATHAALEVPLLAGPARLLRAALEKSPTAVFRTLGLGWKLGYRRMGVIAFRASGEREGTVVFEGLPEPVLDSEGMRVALEGIVAAAAERCADDVRPLPSRVSRGERKLEIPVRW